MQKHCSARVILQKTVTYRVGIVQRECSFTFCGVLQVQKHCSARVISSTNIFFFCVCVSKYLLYTTLEQRSEEEEVNREEPNEISTSTSKRKLHICATVSGLTWLQRFERFKVGPCFVF